MWYYIIGIFLIVIVTLIYSLFAQRNKYLQESTNDKKKLKESYDKCLFYLKENLKMKKLISLYENEKYDKITTFNVCGGEIKKDPIYKGKRALIGDYLLTSYSNTENVLRSLGFSVDIVPKMKDVVDKIKYGEHYDIIFSNNFYHDGSGQECLKKLKEIQDFNTPIVVHTIDKNKRDFFVKEVGFDDYIEKPVTQEKVKLILNKLIEKL